MAACCCQCNGVNAKCIRCVCTKEKRPFVSCLPSKSNKCQNLLSCRQKAIVKAACSPPVSCPSLTLWPSSPSASSTPLPGASLTSADLFPTLPSTLPIDSCPVSLCTWLAVSVASAAGFLLGSFQRNAILWDHLYCVLKGHPLDNQSLYSS